MRELLSHKFAVMRKKKMCYLFLLPFMLLFFIFTVLPVLCAIGLSFTHYNVLQPPQWVGLDNYIQLFFYDDVFLKSLLNTLTMALFIGPIGYFASFFLAWMLTELSRGLRTILVVLFYAPCLTNMFTIWTIILSGDSYGLLNSVLLSLGVVSEPIQWLTDTVYMMPVVIIVSLWTSLGAGFLSFVAGLQGVDNSLYEAGLIDGVKNRWQELWFITLPSMKPQLLFGAVMSIGGAFTVGNVSSILCGNPSTDYAVHTLILHASDYAGIRLEMGYASAVSTVLFAMMIVSNNVVQKLLRKVGE